jgi:cytoskeletal protein CcmA (bactofilin family)
MNRNNVDTPVEESMISDNLTIRGDLTSSGDLSIKGFVDGDTLATENSVTICEGGRVNGHIFGKKILVEGQLRGNLYAEEKVILKSSADVHGNIFSPTVSLEEGGVYRGRINMESKARRMAAARSKARQH